MLLHALGIFILYAPFVIDAQLNGEVVVLPSALGFWTAKSGSAPWRQVHRLGRIAAVLDREKSSTNTFMISPRIHHKEYYIRYTNRIYSL